MITYQSTRNGHQSYTFSEAVLQPISSDGGLLVPRILPQISLKQLKSLLYKPYSVRFAKILDLFETDLPSDVIKEIARKAYSSNFSSKKIAPLIHLKDTQYILELWYGPTSAFKDMALQVVPYFLLEAARMKNQQRIKKNLPFLKYLILVVTTGDTGKAALEGFKDKKGFSIIVFYPENVSKLQELQMTTQEGRNVFVYKSRGDVDLTDTLVKEIYKNKKFNKKLLDKYSVALSSANSTNWARIIPQITYHISSYIDLVEQEVIQLGDEIDIAVPTGSFGNILSAYYAKKMGVPIRKLICASNENHLITEFLQTGVYDTTHHKLVSTPSNSMDTLIAYNVERLLYEITQNAEQITLWMNELNTKGRFKVDNKTIQNLQKEFYPDWVTNDDCLNNIKKVFGKTEYLMDPHTSVAQKVTEKYLKNVKKQVPIVIVSTAHWSKFPKSTYMALNGTNEIPINEFRIIEKIKKLVPNTYLPQNIVELEHKIVLHNQRCEPTKEDIEKVILDLLDAISLN